MTPTAGTTPRTAAGRALLELLTLSQAGAYLPDILAIEAEAAPDAGLRAALARAIESGYADGSIDGDLYHNDPVYHAVVWEIRRARLAATEDDWQDHLAAEKRIGAALERSAHRAMPSTRIRKDMESAKALKEGS